ncbi:MAG: dTMP kinase [Planctomycetota bacterium]|jgi:dTMP kinase
MSADDDGPARTDSSARFIILDGVDGCGKSTQASLLVSAWTTASREPLHLREPGSTAAGERIRSVLLEPGVEIGPATEALLFCAARRQTLDELVAPALAAGRDVVCERFHASTFAYQAVAGALSEAALMQLLGDWAGAPEPDATILLEIPARRALERRAGETEDRIEAKGLEFQERVAAGYRRYAELDPRALIVDGEGTTQEVHARVLQALESHLVTQQ